MTAEVIRIGIDARGARTGGQQVRSELGGIKREARGLQNQLVATGRSAVNARNFLLSLATAAGIRQAVTMADTYKLINARLLNVSSSAQEASRGYARLLEMSNRTRSSIEGSAALYTKLILSGKQYGVTQERALKITENVNKALRISGASAIEAASSQLQLSQAIASGTLQGDEFRSVMENAPRLARALVEALKLKGGVGELRKLSREGKLTIDQLVKALTDAKIGEKLEKEFRNIPLTVGQAFEVLKNQTMDAIGNFDKMNFVTQGLSKAIVLLAFNLGTVIQVGFPLLVSWLVRSSGAGLAMGKAMAFLGTVATGTGTRLGALSRFARMYGVSAAFAAGTSRGLGAVVRGLGAIFLNWNTILTIAITLLAYLATRQDAAAQAADRMRDREGRLAQVIDFTTGKINTQNAALLTNIKLKAAADMRAAQAGLATARSKGLTEAGALPTTIGGLGPSSGSLNAVQYFKNKLFGPSFKNVGDTQLSRMMTSFFSTGKGAGTTLKYLDDLNAKGAINAKVYERATKAIGDFQQIAKDLDDANSELRILNGKGDKNDLLKFGVGVPQPPITSPNISKKVKDGKSKADELNARLEKAQANAGKLSDIMSRWDDQPKLIDQANRDKNALQEMVGEWVEINGQVTKYTQAMADLGKQKIDEGLTRSIDEDIEAGKDALVVQALLLRGENVYAEAVRRVLDYKRQGIPVDEERYQLILKQVAAEDQLAKALEKQQKMIDIYKGALSEIQGAFEQFLIDFKPKNFLKSIGQSLRQLQARIISEKIFGPLYQQVEDMITGKKGVRGANEFLAQQVQESGTHLDKFDEAIVDTTNLLGQVNQKLQEILNGGVPSSPEGGGAATTGPNGEIVITGPGIVAGDKTDHFFDFIDLLFGKVTKPITDVLRQLGIKLPKNIGEKLGPIVQTAFESAAIGPGIADALGLQKNRGGMGKQIGAAIGGTLGKLAGTAIGGPIGGMIGQVLGSVAGSLLGGALTPVKQGGARITSVDGAATGFGNSGSMRTAALGAAGNVQGGLKRIAEVLGGGTGSFNVTIGQRHGDWRVTTGSSLKIKNGAKDFNGDQEAAIRYAISLAVQQGAITGLRAATQRLLQGNSDLDVALEKAVKFENVFKELDKLRDPATAGFKDLNKEFKDLIALFKEAGASTEDWGQLEELYNLKRKELIKSQVEELQRFLDDLKGDSSFKTAYDRLQDANLKFKDFEDKIAAGQTVDQSEFTDAGQRLQDLAREVYGSTPEFFQYQDRLITATEHAIKNIQDVADKQENILIIRDAIQAQTDLIAQNQAVQNEYLRVIANSVGGGSISGGTRESVGFRTEYY